MEAAARRHGGATADLGGRAGAAPEVPLGKAVRFRKDCGTQQTDLLTTELLARLYEFPRILDRNVILNYLLDYYISDIYRMSRVSSVTLSTLIANDGPMLILG